MKRFNDPLFDLLALIEIMMIFYSVLCYLDFHRAVLPPSLNW